MKIIGTIQARLSSTRLPGKVLKEICGKPMLVWHVERLRRSRLLDDVVVATTLNSNDDPIVKLCEARDIKYFRGSEDDVLGRVASAIKYFDAETHVEFFGDSPLTDPHIVDEVVGFYLKNKGRFDYVTNALKTTYPPGQEVTVYPGRILIEVDQVVRKDDPMREHVNIHVTQRKDKYRICNLEAPEHYCYPDIYLEVDTLEDFKFISSIVEHFVKDGRGHFSLAQILEYLLANPRLIKMNQDVKRRWKAFK